MTEHLLWLWLWYFIGSAIYMLKRAYYLVTGPNPIANSYGDFFKRCWIPLLVRFAIDSGIYWCLFTPQLAAAGLSYLGWEKFSWVLTASTQLAPVALFFGMGIDSIVDFAVSKVPGLKDWLPQMPGPLPTPVPSKQQQEELKKEK